MFGFAGSGDRGDSARVITVTVPSASRTRHTEGMSASTVMAARNGAASINDDRASAATAETTAAVLSARTPGFIDVKVSNALARNAGTVNTRETSVSRRVSTRISRAPLTAASRMTVAGVLSVAVRPA